MGALKPSILIKEDETIFMNDMLFYYPNGEIIKDKETFIDFYSKYYYMNNSIFVENEIEKLLSKGKNNISEKDIFRILAWKIGKINHKKSTSEQKIIYCKGWNEKRLTAKIYEKPLDSQYFSCIKKSILGIEGEQLKDYIGKLGNINYLGPVYIITLRYFATKGKYPIYDRFAYKAVQAILDNTIKVGKTIKEKNVSFKKIDDIYNDYLKTLKSIFLEQYNERRVDKALWSYGHLF